MSKTLYLFVTSDRPDQYINPILHCTRNSGVNRVVLLYIKPRDNGSPISPYAPTSISGVVLNNVIALFDSLALRGKYVYRGGDKSKEGQEVDLRAIYGEKWDIIVEKFYQPFRGSSNIVTEDIPYTELRTRMAYFYKQENDCIFDVTAVSKSFLGDIIAICITEGITNLYTLDVGIPNFSEPWKSLLHDLEKYQYVNVLNTEIYKECSEIVRGLQIGQVDKQHQEASEALEQANKEVVRFQRLFRWTMLSLLVILSFLVVFVLPTVFTWPWLAQHPRKLGLQICVMLFLSGLSWAIADNKNRQLSLTTIVVAALLAISQII